MIKRSTAIAALATMAAGAAFAQAARDHVNIVGSSTVYPFTTVVAEQFGRTSSFKTPKVESTGTGGGFKLFCGGVGVQHPDIANASRAIKDSEIGQCRANGVEDIIEVKIGYDGIVIANARDGANYDFRLQDLYMGLAKQVPGGEDFVANPNTAWNQVNPALGAQRILVYGPPTTSGTRDAFLELGMAPGAEQIPALAAIKASDEDRFETLAHTLREDGSWIDAGENDNAIVQTLTRTPGSLGVFGFSFLEQNMDSVKPQTIDGVTPTVATIADGSYPLARSLYIYVKKAHIGVTPDLQEFVQAFLSDAAAARGGYLQDRGLVPLQETELAAERAKVASGAAMSKPE